MTVCLHILTAISSGHSPGISTQLPYPYKLHRIETKSSFIKYGTTLWAGTHT